MSKRVTGTSTVKGRVPVPGIQEARALGGMVRARRGSSITTWLRNLLSPRQRPGVAELRAEITGSSGSESADENKAGEAGDKTDIVVSSDSMSEAVSSIRVSGTSTEDDDSILISADSERVGDSTEDQESDSFDSPAPPRTFTASSGSDSSPTKVSTNSSTESDVSPEVKPWVKAQADKPVPRKVIKKSVGGQKLRAFLQGHVDSAKALKDAVIQPSISSIDSRADLISNAIAACVGEQARKSLGQKKSIQLLVALANGVEPVGREFQEAIGKLNHDLGKGKKPGQPADRELLVRRGEATLADVPVSLQHYAKGVLACREALNFNPGALRELSEVNYLPPNLRSNFLESGYASPARWLYVLIELRQKHDRLNQFRLQGKLPQMLLEAYSKERDKMGIDQKLIDALSMEKLSQARSHVLGWEVVGTMRLHEYEESDSEE